MNLEEDNTDMKLNKWDLLTEKIFRHFQEIKNRSYPLLLEKKEIKEALEKLQTRSDSFYLFDEEDEEIQGICGYYIIEEEQYLQTTILVSFNHNQKFIDEVLTHLKKTYPGYTLHIGLEAENTFVIEVLKNNGF